MIVPKIQVYVNNLLSSTDAMSMGDRSLQEMIIDHLRDNFPGNYTVVCYKNFETLDVCIDLQFDDPTEQTMFALKWL